MVAVIAVLVTLMVGFLSREEKEGEEEIKEKVEAEEGEDDDNDNEGESILKLLRREVQNRSERAKLALYAY